MFYISLQLCTTFADKHLCQRCWVAHYTVNTDTQDTDITSFEGRELGHRCLSATVVQTCK